MRKYALSVSMFFAVMFLFVSLFKQSEELKPVSFSEPEFKTYVAISSLKLDDGTLDADDSADFQIEVIFDEKTKLMFPRDGEITLVNGDDKRMNFLFEIPKHFVHGEGIDFSIQIHRSDEWYEPCRYGVHKVLSFNRTYVCSPDQAYQAENGREVEELDKTALQIEVFTDRRRPKSRKLRKALAKLK